MSKLTALIEAAKEDANLRNPDALNGYGDDILELCDLLEKAAGALAFEYVVDGLHQASIETLDELKQWVEQT